MRRRSRFIGLRCPSTRRLRVGPFLVVTDGPGRGPGDPWGAEWTESGKEEIGKPSKEEEEVGNLQVEDEESLPEEPREDVPRPHPSSLVDPTHPSFSWGLPVQGWERRSVYGTLRSSGVSVVSTGKEVGVAGPW